MKIDIKFFHFLAAVLLNQEAAYSDVFTKHTNEVWMSSTPLLSTPSPQTPKTKYPVYDGFIEIFVRSLKNQDQARELVKLQAEKGTKRADSRKGILTPSSSSPKLSSSSGALKEVTKSIGLFMQKETKGDFLPESLRRGIRFSNEDGEPNIPTAGLSERADLKYGLILTGIEPSSKSMRIASTDSRRDLEMAGYAPRAKLAYVIGPVYSEEAKTRYTVKIAANTPAEKRSDLLNWLPSMKFKGRLAPSGLPTAGSPLPPHLLSLEQSDGFYTFEARLEKGAQTKSVTHKFRLPLATNMAYREERGKDFTIVKNSLENLYSHGPLALNLEHYAVEKRSQVGVAWKAPGYKLEAISHVPDAALENRFWPQHRMELKAEISF